MIKFRPRGEEQEPSLYLKKCIIALTDYLFDDVRDTDLVGLRILNTENVQDKVMGISFRRQHQVKPDLIWGMLGKVVQSNARFGLTDKLEVHLNHVRMPGVNGREKTKASSDLMSATKKNIVAAKAAFLCLVQALIAVALVNGDPKYKSYRDCYGLKNLLKNT